MEHYYIDIGCTFRGHKIYVPWELAEKPDEWPGNLYFFDASGQPHKLPAEYWELAREYAYSFEELTVIADGGA